MKKFLLASAMMLCLVASKAQNVYLNEIFTSPAPGNHEYFELYNEGMNVLGEDLSNYTLVAYYTTVSGEQGFYVLNLPNQTITAQGFFTGSSQNFMSYPGGSATANYSWNDQVYMSTHNASTVKYTLNAQGTGYTTSTGNYTDIFVQSGGGRNPNRGIYAVMLFYNGTIQDGFLGRSPQNSLPAEILSMPDLPASSMNGATGPISLSALANFEFENVAANAGTDGGYHRSTDGRNCGGRWARSSNDNDFTPGESNGEGNGQFNTHIDFECGASVFTYNILSGPAPAFPVTVSLYYDVNNNGMWDLTDVLVGTNIELTAGDPAFSFNVVPDVSLILVLNASIGNSCSNNVIAFDCGAGGPTPVTLVNFNATQRLGLIELDWETSMESNNRGFEIQRRVNGQFEPIGFEETKAIGGNSTLRLNYRFTDDDNLPNGIIYYRLRQVDYDGNFAYSEIKAVRNNTKEVSVTVYPNPSNGNTKLIVPSEVGKLDISIVDIHGRVVSRYANFTGTRLDINNLRSGIYMIRVFFNETGKQVIEKLIVQ